jgi:malonyl-CoA O-methyltransferase
MVNKAQVQENFGKYAVSYDQYALVQKEMAQELLEIIKQTKHSFRNILEIGCGTGFLTELLARQYPKARIMATDIAPEMIVMARKKLAGFSNISYFTADGENLAELKDKVGSQLHFDLIVSNVVFQWFSDYAAAFAQFHSCLKEDGHLIFSTLGSGTFQELYLCLNDNQNEKTAAKDSASLTIVPGDTDPEKKCSGKEPFIDYKHLLNLLIKTGFQQTSVVETTKQEYFSSCREFLKSLKMIGAHNYLNEELAAKGLGSGIFSLIKRYDTRFSEEYGVPATYRCLYAQGIRAT